LEIGLHRASVTGLMRLPRKRRFGGLALPPEAPIDILRTLHRVTHEIRTLDRDTPRVPTLGARLGELLRQRATAWVRLPDHVRTAYRRARARRQPPIALIRGERCSGCHARVSPPRGGGPDGEISCPRCFRLLAVAGSELDHAE
jgi:hypothetical protein